MEGFLQISLWDWDSILGNPTPSVIILPGRVYGGNLTCTKPENEATPQIPTNSPIIA
jgi:hypothetical protein